MVVGGGAVMEGGGIWAALHRKFKTMQLLETFARRCHVFYGWT